MAYMDSSFKKLIGSATVQIPTRTKHARMDDEVENDPNPERPQKVIIPSDHRPIKYLLIMWKILTAHIREEIYYSLEYRVQFPQE